MCEMGWIVTGMHFRTIDGPQYWVILPRPFWYWSGHTSLITCQYWNHLSTTFISEMSTWSDCFSCYCLSEQNSNCSAPGKTYPNGSLQELEWFMSRNLCERGCISGANPTGISMINDRDFRKSVKILQNQSKIAKIL